MRRRGGCFLTPRSRGSAFFVRGRSPNKYFKQALNVRRGGGVNFLTPCTPTSLKLVEGSSLYADIPGFHSLSIITGKDLRADLLLRTKNKCFYILELMIGFETNLNNNTERRSLKYSQLVSDLKSQYIVFTFVDLSMSSLGIFANLINIINIAIRTSYYVFCYHNK